MPGLTVCLGCGLDLTTPPPEPVSLMPQVSARNPLERRPTPVSERPPRPILDSAGLELVVPLLQASLWGLLPGLGALQRGDPRRAGLQLGALVSCVVLYLLLWTHPAQDFVPYVALSIWAQAIITEQRARGAVHDGVSPWPGVLLALTMCLGLWSARGVVSHWAFPTVSMAGGPALEAGSYLVRAVPLDELDRDSLVVRGRPGLFLYREVRVAPVIALPGQTISSDGRGTVLVDGQPPAVPPLRRGTPTRLAEQVVPPGHVVVLDQWVKPIAYEDIQGVLYYQWLPHSSRGPLQWPPDLFQPSDGVLP